MRTSVIKSTLATATAVFLIGGTAPVLAQTAASAPVVSATSATPGAPDAKAAARAAKKQARAEARAKRKAERKAARAKNAAELKRLEDAGYRPPTNDPNYPERLQDAEKKANAAAGASQ
ncbi:conserved exported protein of unknown function [Burkholderia multivorans]